jgi:hypothetical protein
MTRHYLYRISVPDGRAYIGITDSPQRRFSQHRCADTAIGRAIRQYGPDNCKFEILREGSEFDIKDLENRYIRLHRTEFPAGYNGAPFPGAIDGEKQFLESLNHPSPVDTLWDPDRFDAIFSPALPPEMCPNGGWLEMTANRFGRHAIEQIFPGWVFLWQPLKSRQNDWRSSVSNLPQPVAHCADSLRCEHLILTRLPALGDGELASLMAEAAQDEGARATWRPAGSTAVHPFFARFEGERTDQQGD